MADGSARSAVIAAAAIGAFGAVVAATISSWDKLFPRPSPIVETPIDPPPEVDLSERTYRVGPVTLRGIRLDTTLPTTLHQGQLMNASFEHEVCCGAGAHVWVRPEFEGAACTYGASGSPKHRGSGTGRGWFRVRGEACRAARLASLRVSAARSDEGATSDRITIPLDAPQ